MAENLRIKATQKSPGVSFNIATGFLEIKGRSITENAFSFYQPLIDWATDFLNKYFDDITISLSFDYINS
ncbi:MAG: DUF1987 family protein, partial [Bacteroidia bacterium]|nr:DUF1987 family protein [Bacteroidia bacterium]